MFNLGTLTITALLTMGVANATPICNAEKEHKYTTKKNATSSENINDYELYLEQINYGYATYNNEIVQEGFRGTDTEAKYNYRTTSNYLNIIGTRYKTITDRLINNEIRYYYQNYEKLIGNIDNIYSNVRQDLLILQITPYNYNINTESVINLTFSVDDWTDTSGNETIITNKYLLTNVYQTVTDWTTFIDRQITSFAAKNIIEEIQDINNNFYYTKTSNIEEISSNSFVKNVEIPLTPNKTNYIAIQMIPCLKCSYYDYGQDTIEDYGTNVSTIPVIQYNTDITSIVIKGTNIIPQGGTYEVIDIPSLMWDILTMPFAFVSQAFNLTLFPNTPYQLNISNLFLSIIAIVVFIWLIGFFLKLKG